MNQPERYECYVLEADETKIKYVKDTKHEHSATFTILKEDHTLGNAVRMQLLGDSRVLFAGYKIPHPLLNELIIKVRTNGATTPTNCLIDCVDALNINVKDVEAKFNAEIKKFQTGNTQFNQYR